MSRMASGSNPPAWALVELRDDSRGTPGQPTPTTTPTPTLNGSTTPETPSKPPSMMSPRDFEFLKELGSGSWSTVRRSLAASSSESEYLLGHGGLSCGDWQAVCSQDTQQSAADQAEEGQIRVGGEGCTRQASGNASRNREDACRFPRRDFAL